MDAPKTRDTRLDFARAVAISLVLMWHLKPLQVRVFDNSPLLIKVLGQGVELFYLQISLIAVPLFYLVSLYLFFQKLEKRPLERMRTRLLRLGELYFFWTACQFAVYYVVESRIQDGLVNVTIPFTPERLIQVGGPPLPYVGGSVFYFLFVLMLLVIVCSFYSTIRKFPKVFNLIGIMLVVMSLVYFENQNLHNHDIRYWGVENFLLYIPLAFFLSRNGRSRLEQNLHFFSFLGFILFSVHDVYLRNRGGHFNVYGRVSIVFGAMALFSFILNLKSIKLGKMSTFISQYSLGIFATHKYWLLFVILVLNYFGFFIPDAASNFPIGLRSLLEAMLAIGLTFPAIFLASHTRLKRYLS